MHSSSTQEVLDRLGADVQNGLTADEVSRRREQYGENRLREKKKKTTQQMIS